MNPSSRDTAIKAIGRCKDLADTITPNECDPKRLTVQIAYMRGTADSYETGYTDGYIDGLRAAKDEQCSDDTIPVRTLLKVCSNG